MCWILVIHWWNIDLEDRIKRWLEPIKHRWTNHIEYKIFDWSALWANRLPIQWKESWIQPLYNEDKTIRAVQNGEIFNYLELKEMLEDKWHAIRTDCDTELLVHLYEEFGWPGMLQYIDSEMFFFAIYDSKKNNTFVAKDPFWTKPWYMWYDKRWSVYFASEMKQLIALEDVQDIYHFPAGHYYQDKQLHTRYKLSISEHIQQEEMAVKLISKALEEAVRKRVETNPNDRIYVLLSGWVDSATVCELANKYHNDVMSIILWVNED